MTAFALNDTTAPQPAVSYATGVLLRARLYSPAGATLVDLALTEASGRYAGTVSAGALPDASAPYQYEVREVSVQTAGAYNVSVTPAVSRGTYGYLFNAAWYPDAATYTAAVILGASAGAGDKVVNHDAGGTDNLRYVTGQVGVGDGIVRAYLRSEYDAGNYAERGRTSTRVDGRWRAPMYLYGGFEYTFVFVKPGVYGPTVKNLTIAA